MVWLFASNNESDKVSKFWEFEFRSIIRVFAVRWEEVRVKVMWVRFDGLVKDRVSHGWMQLIWMFVPEIW
jgi:hypothetical protein